MKTREQLVDVFSKSCWLPYKNFKRYDNSVTISQCSVTASITKCMVSRIGFKIYHPLDSYILSFLEDGSRVRQCSLTSLSLLDIYQWVILPLTCLNYFSHTPGDPYSCIRHRKERIHHLTTHEAHLQSTENNWLTIFFSRRLKQIRYRSKLTTHTMTPYERQRRLYRNC